MANKAVATRAVLVIAHRRCCLVGGATRGTRTGCCWRWANAGDRMTQDAAVTQFGRRIVSVATVGTRACAFLHPQSAPPASGAAYSTRSGRGRQRAHSAARGARRGTCVPPRSCAPSAPPTSQRVPSCCSRCRCGRPAAIDERMRRNSALSVCSGGSDGRGYARHIAVAFRPCVALRHSATIITRCYNHKPRSIWH